MFSTSASASDVRSSASRTSAGTRRQPGRLRGAPAALAGDQLPAVAAGSRTSSGCTMPSRRTLSTSSAKRSSSMRARGWRGFGRDLLDRDLAQRAAATRACGSPSSSARPCPSPRRGGALSTLDDLEREPVVGVGAARVGVVLRDRQAVARRLGEAHGARHDRREDLGPEVRRAPRARRRPRAACGGRTSSAAGPSARDRD